ncbi:PilN domain-containing protein [Vibrio sp. ZSDE26]|uniref:PilN domain-containing protein n=1 Tax=Vibrio amylolyticus TaxID=2847292 RepID=A0A9X1XPL3_9VIBR|nr:PilN domain-containing protein [Vibrio amylolyticus]MCK6263169.1 PilN domain-containing protein [Vibrio amylolyticus]
MLASINLLPWRDERREQHKRRFVSLVVLTLLLSFLIQYALGWYFSGELQQQQGRINYFTQYIEQLDRRINDLKLTERDHAALLTRLSVVEKLQKSRNRSTEFMVEIQNLIPEGVYVDKIKLNGHDVEMVGISDSTAHLAGMLDNLEKSAFLSDVYMHSIVHDQKRFNHRFQTFKVSFRIALNEPSLKDTGGENG